VQAGLTGVVDRWRDVKPTGEGHDFVRIDAKQERQAYDKATVRLQQARSATALVRAFVEGSGSPRLHLSGRGSVAFPCGLVAAGLELRAGMTLFFVIRPVAFEAGDQAVGQRFFGTYPSGQFRFRDGHVALRSDSAEYVLSGMEPVASEWNLVAYRLGPDDAPEAAIGGAPLRPMGALRGGARPVTFSATPVTLGGSNSDCSFAGEIAEVLIFGTALDDDAAFAAASYLANRHGLPLAPADGRTVHVGDTATAMAAYLPASPARREGGAKLRGGSSSRKDTAAPPDESLKLLKQMEDLKAQLDALMRKPQGMSVPAAVGGGSIPARSATRSATAPAAPRGGKCSAGDAFSGMSVEEFEPPAIASLEDTQQWEDTHKAVFYDIKNFDKGGKPLREFIHAKVNGLKVLRHNIFCKYV
jgi:hypothetical protein